MPTAAQIEQGSIRLAESQDIPQIVELGWENAGATGYRAKMVYNANTLRMFVGTVLADQQARCIVYEHAGAIQGVFAFTTFPNFYQFGGALIASMIIWSVAKRFRGRVSMRLLSHAQREARKLGATRLILTGPGKQFQKLAEHCGYEYLESSYMVVL